MKTVDQVGTAAQKAWFLIPSEWMSRYDISEKQIKENPFSGGLMLMVQVKSTNRSSKNAADGICTAHRAVRRAFLLSYPVFRGHKLWKRM